MAGETRPACQQSIKLKVVLFLILYFLYVFNSSQSASLSQFHSIMHGLQWSSVKAYHRRAIPDYSTRTNEDLIGIRFADIDTLKLAAPVACEAGKSA
jgi:hypothetical protein